jgi:protein-tyrosine phosphatase
MLILVVPATGILAVHQTPRSQHYALDRGFDMGDLRARLVTEDDFNHFDYIFAMDKQNLADLKAMRPRGYSGELGLFLSLCQNPDYSKLF